MFGLKRTAGTRVRRIDVAEFEALRAKNPHLYVLDVREPYELKAFGAIPNVVNIPLGSLRQRAGELPSRKETTIVAVCQSGARSQQAAAQLAALGYGDVHSLDGGTAAWLRRR